MGIGEGGVGGHGSTSAVEILVGKVLVKLFLVRC